MKRLFIICLSVFILSVSSNAQQYTLPLWESEMPNHDEKGIKETLILEENGFLVARDIQNPDIAVFLPSKMNATGEAVIICPGGGYQVIVYNWEGTDIAKALNAKGIAAIVLKYRLPISDDHIIKHKSALMDAQRAMRTVRFNAEKWNIDHDKIGIMGFSAGGHLAGSLSTHYDNGNQNSKDSIETMSCRPDFSVLVYPVVSSEEDVTHLGSRNNLIGENPTQELLDDFSNDKNVTKDTPPAILFHSSDDDVVPVKNSILYYEALQAKGVFSELHVYSYGGHGFSLAIGKGHLSSWIDRCSDWINYVNQ